MHSLFVFVHVGGVGWLGASVFVYLSQCLMLSIISLNGFHFKGLIVIVNVL